MIKYVTFLLCPCVSCNPHCSPTISPGFWKRIFNGCPRYSCLNLNYNGEFMWKCSSRVMVLRRWLQLPSSILHAADARPFPVRWNHFSWCSDYLAPIVCYPVSLTTRSTVCSYVTYWLLKRPQTSPAKLRRGKMASKLSK